ncbi:hypothetical protein RBA63_00300 [Brenneria goodwinii]|uniref:hypothetical protein n=1 Tax=Brenneria goodwinii TaxID=1109412 RepID=UPI0036EB273E
MYAVDTRHGGVLAYTFTFGSKTPGIAATVRTFQYRHDTSDESGISQIEAEREAPYFLRYRTARKRY